MEHRARWTFWLKPIFLLIVLVGVGIFFARILTSETLQATDSSRTPGQILWDQLASASLPGLLAGGLLYLLGLVFPALFWLLLLRRAGERLPWLTTFRTYYLSHLGKYAPFGKGFALLVRVALSSMAGVRAGTAAVTGAYETLTMMAAGALLAVGVVVWEVEGTRGQLWAALGLLALAGVPLLPGVFDRLVKPLAGRFLAHSLAWPKPGVGALLLGLGMMALCWTLLGTSFAVVIHALQPGQSGAALDELLRCTAFVAVSYVAGFVAATPAGLGVRDFLLQQMLAPRSGPQAVLVVLVLRVLWTIAELSIAGVMYLVPVRHAPVLETPVSPPPADSPAKELASPSLLSR